MVKTRPAYIMVSRTDTGIARLIRGVTQYPYNHVSVTLDPGFESWYSFARYVQDTPFYGGFIRETPGRLLGKSGQTRVRIFRVDIPEQSAQRLEALLPLAGNPDSGLIYNHFDAAAGALGLRVRIPGCHTCLSFACSLLNREFGSIRELCDGLAEHEIYEGSLAALTEDAGTPDVGYCSRLGLVRGSSRSAAQLGVLAYRTLAHGFESYKAHFFRRRTL